MSCSCRRRRSRRISSARLCVLLMTSTLAPGSLAAEEKLPFDCGPRSFTIVGVPDTQGHAPEDDHLLESFRFVLEQKALWKRSHGRDGCNIVFVTGYGDVAQEVRGARGVAQMKRMSELYGYLQDKQLGVEGDPQIPYHVGTGNHDSVLPVGLNDYETVALFNADRATSFLEHFPPERFTAFAEGGANEEPLVSWKFNNRHESKGSVGVNTWQIVPTGLEVDGRPLDFLHLGLEFAWASKDSRVLTWANERLAEHPGRLAFVTTHANVRVQSADPDLCGSAYGPRNEKMFRKLMNCNAKVVAVMNGHTLPRWGTSPECYIRRSNGFSFDTFQFYNNYQEEGPEGQKGLGYLVFFTFDLPDKELRVSVYSARHGFRDGRRSNGEKSSSLRFDYDVLAPLRDAKPTPPTPAGC